MATFIIRVLNKQSWTSSRKLVSVLKEDDGQFCFAVNSSNGASVTVEASHEYHTGWAPIRCHIAAEDLMPVVQNLMYEVITDGGFQSLLR